MPKYNRIIGKISVKSDQEVEWTIDNLFSYTKQNQCYFSPHFIISGSKWNFLVHPNGETAFCNTGWIGLHLEMDLEGEADDSLPVGAYYTFGVKKMDGTVEPLQTEFEEDNSFLGTSRALERSLLLRRRSELAPSGSLTFTCSLLTEKYFESPGNLDTLSRNLADLFASKINSDSTLMVKGREFSVHKFLLSARSPVLAAMFEADMKEKRTGIVEIEDCDPEAFSVFLAYLYSGKVEKGSANILELYKIADKYDVQDLRLFCRMSIILNLSVENVLDAVILGRLFCEDCITDKTQSFFNQNYSKIIPSDKWEKFINENTTVANELLNGMAKLKEAEKW